MFTDKAALIFMTQDSEDERLFELLNNAYVQARYNKDFVVTKEDVQALLTKIEALSITSKEISEEKISEHELRLNQP